MTTNEPKLITECCPSPFPDDFGRRLERLKELAGVSWREFAGRIGVTERGMLKWRRGAPPSGAYLWAIIELAREVPGGYEIVMGADAGMVRKEMRGPRCLEFGNLDRIEDYRAPPWPDDFPAYLERLEEMSGITLEEFADVLGLAEERPGKWRSGEIPDGDEMCAMIHWASRVPGGLSVLLTGCPYSLQFRG